MWKFVTRGLRETLERRACRMNVYSQTSQDSNTKNEVKQSLTCNHKLLSPNFCSNNKDCWKSAKADGAKGNEDDTKWRAKHTWTEAMGWTSVLAVGWVVCQSLCLNRKFLEKDQIESLKAKIVGCPQSETDHLCSLLSQIHVNAKHFLPVTNCVAIRNETNIGINERYIPSEPFGPITVEEALTEATDEFAIAHKFALSKHELLFGIKAIEEKRYNDAVKHFAIGAKLSSPESMFNLGICHELGLGTLTDPIKAARYYRNAAEHGHADAIYNLGVYYAQGKGGFTVDINTAREYFIKAAKLGQVQAQYALQLENMSTQSNKTNDNITRLNTRKCSIDNSHSDNANENLTKHDDIIKNTSKTSKYKQIDTDESPTKMFLELLGLRELTAIPVAVDSTSIVPC